jgi:2-oxoglutarate dehydrogenase E2 component (dihydrolipoamide succinyltransferase)
MIEIRLPQISMGVVDCQLANWLKKVGDRVKQGEAVAEVDTDKTITEITAPEAGTLVEIRFEAGDTIAVGDVMGIIDEE